MARLDAPPWLIVRACAAAGVCIAVGVGTAVGVRDSAGGSVGVPSEWCGSKRL
jgi:hypothetical protein